VRAHHPKPIGGSRLREFQQGLANWLAEPPIPEQLTVVGSYNLF